MRPSDYSLPDYTTAFSAPDTQSCEHVKGLSPPRTSDERGISRLRSQRRCLPTLAGCTCGRYDVTSSRLPGSLLE
jgi:hypothetical protein